MKPLYILCAFFLFTTTLFAQNKIRILFIGNSYVTANDLPRTLAQVAGGLGDTVIYDSSAPGGYTFQQHSTYAPTLAKIAQGGWDFVVLQEQSQRPSFSPGQVERDVYPYAHILDSLIHAADSCTETIFYLTWGKKFGDASNCAVYPPVCTYAGSQDRISQSYTEMGQLNSAAIAPAGEAWRKVINDSSNIELYNADQTHPSIHGTYLTASVLYEILFRKHVLNDTFVTPGISDSDATTLRRAAYATVNDSLSKWLSPGHIPVASFAHVVAGPVVTFSSTSINGTDFSWHFGDGQTGAGATTTHTYQSSGRYLVTLIVTDHCMTDSLHTYVSLVAGPTGIVAAEYPVLKIYPNPAHSVLCADVADSEIGATITLANGIGQIVRKTIATSAHLTMPVSDLPAGLYTLSAPGASYRVAIVH